MINYCCNYIVYIIVIKCFFEIYVRSYVFLYEFYFILEFNNQNIYVCVFVYVYMQYYVVLIYYLVFFFKNVYKYKLILLCDGVFYCINF